MQQDTVIMFEVKLDTPFEGWHLTSNPIAFIRNFPGCGDWKQIGNRNMIVCAQRAVEVNGQHLPYGDAFPVLEARFSYGPAGEECGFLPGRQLMCFHIADRRCEGSEVFWNELATRDGEAGDLAVTALFGALRKRPAIERVREVIWREFNKSGNRPVFA